VNQAVNEWAESEGVAVVDPYGGDIETRQARTSTAFYLTANKSAEAQRLVSHVISLGLKRIAIVYVKEQVGQASLVAFEEGLSVADLSPTAELPVAGDGANAEAVIAALGSLKPQAVLLATSGSATLAILKALPRDPATGLLQVYGLSSAAGQTELQSIGAAARGFAMTQVLPPPDTMTTKLSQTFMQAMREAYPGARGGNYVQLEGCLSALAATTVLAQRAAKATRASALQAFTSHGFLRVEGFEINLSDRNKSGARFTDIVLIGGDGRVSH
jgi:ABC-type branched-subunit amino acid transport system substrate-binding protein